MNGTKGCLFDGNEWAPLSVKRRCELLGVARSSVYYKAKKPDDEDRAYDKH